MSEELLICFNKGCGQKYRADENSEGSCHYHPGGPIFHDALKGWSCCKKRSSDFTEFLNFPGCTTGTHCNVKPSIQSETPNIAPNDGEVVQLQSVNWSHPRLPKEAVLKLERPCESIQKNPLPRTVAASLIAQLSKLAGDKAEKQSEESGDIKVGTACHNNSCGKYYENESSLSEKCQFHPGTPIFHEGMKYWSCCERKTSDFDNFLRQAGCQFGKHVWAKPNEGVLEKEASCRVDWHQTPGFVTISIFSKLSVPDQCTVDANQVTILCDIIFEGGKKQFSKTYVLAGIVDLEKSNVKFLSTKVEINLKKAEAGSWNMLALSKDA